MRVLSLFVTLFYLGLSTSLVFGQIKVDKPLDSENYVSILRNSKDSLYIQILKKFDTYLLQNPQDVSVAIEKCRVIENAYYDVEDDYNPKYDEFEACINDLIRNFSDNPEVNLLKLDNLYGDSAILFCEQIIDRNDEVPDAWPDYKLAEIHERLAREYDYQEERNKVLTHADIAESLNDTLDLSLLIAEQYMAVNKYEQVELELLRSLDSADNAWESRRKGELLLQIGKPEKALEAFNFARRDTSAWIDNADVARALVENGMFQEAREFLLRDLEDSYNKTASLHKLFAYDYKYSPADTTLATYNQLQDLDFLNDAFGRYRLMMILKTPWSGWKGTDILKFLIFALVIILVLIIPYLWILPIHYTGTHFNLAGTPTSLAESQWGLKHFWLLSSAILFLEFFSSFLFSYQDLIATVTDSFYVAEEARISENQANLALFYFIGMLILVMLFLKRKDYQYLNAKKWSAHKGILTGIGFAFLLRMIYFSMVKMGIMPDYNAATIGSIIDFFKSINTYYHPLLSFAFIVVLIPIYEEYLFRGIALGAMEKHIKYIAANIIQALFFALMHDNLSLFFFYFSFGLVAGYLVRRSGSMAPSIAFHMTNNLLAFISLANQS